MKPGKIYEYSRGPDVLVGFPLGLDGCSGYTFLPFRTKLLVLGPEKEKNGEKYTSVLVLSSADPYFLGLKGKYGLLRTSLYGDLFREI